MNMHVLIEVSKKNNAIDGKEQTILICHSQAISVSVSCV